MTPDDVMVWLEVAIVVILLIELPLMFVSVWIQLEDVYGITKLRKASRRKLRKFLRQYLHHAKKYVKETDVKVPEKGNYEN
jgi:hypothetical protein